METRTSFYIGGFEIDKMGIVHHSNYPRWFEIGRGDFLKKAGIPSSTINKQGFYLGSATLNWTDFLVLC